MKSQNKIEQKNKNPEAARVSSPGDVSSLVLILASICSAEDKQQQSIHNLAILRPHNTPEFLHSTGDIPILQQYSPITCC
jgi:hypothetical protein